MPTALARLAAVLVLAGAAWGQERWRTTVEPYVWIPSLAGEESADGRPDVEVDVVGELDAAFPLVLRFDAPDGRTAFFVEGLYARWRDDEGSLRTETEVGMVEAGAAFGVGARSELSVGLRRVEVDFDVDLGPLEGSASEAWLDPWMGASGTLPLGEAAALRAHVDVGGFGVGSDFTWQAFALGSWRFGDHVRLDLGYRAIAVEYDDGDLEASLLAHGPILGLALSI